MTTDKGGTQTPERVVFVEEECAVGGDYCAAWSDWFWASVEADPACNEGDGRDPVSLTEYPFDHRQCRNMAKCSLWARATEAKAHD